MSSYAQVAISPLMLGPVTVRLGLDVASGQIARSVRRAVPLNPVILEISATSPDLAEVARASKRRGRSLSTTVAGLAPERPDGSHEFLATTLAPAQVPDQPSSAKVKQNLALGLLVGLTLGTGLALLLRAWTPRSDLKVTSLRSLTDHCSAQSSSMLSDVLPDRVGVGWRHVA